MKEKLPGLFRPLMKFNVTAVMVIILMFSVFNVFSIVRTQQRQASLQTMALSQASQQIGDFIASAEQLGIVVQNDSQLMAYNLYNNRDLPHNIVWELEMLAPSVNSLSSLSIVYVDSLYPQINGVIYSSAGRFSYADYCRDELSGSLTENQLMEVVYAADHAHFVPQLSGNTRSLLYVMPIPSSYVFSPGRLLLRLDYTSFTRGLRATAAENSDIYVFDSEENLLLYFGPTYGNDITAARAAAVGPESLSGKAVFRHELENYGILQAVKACSYPDISRGVGRFFADITRAATLPSYKLAYFDMLSRLNKLIPECAENKQTMLVNMLDLLYENCYESTEVLQQDLYKFCILLADTLYEQRSAQLSGGLLGTIYDYVEENYASPALSLSSIAESLRFSPSYLTRYFKEKTGISLMQYIDRKRFEESKRLLAATALPVKAIVERVGYTDEANFSRKFKKYEGVTPTQYRAMQK